MAMKRRALAVTNVQLEQLTQAAGALPTLWRDPFVQAVARRLTDIPNPTNDDISAAIISTLGGIGIDTPTHVFLCDVASKGDDHAKPRDR